MQLYLLRHGIAEDRKPGRPDAERALTEEGKEKLRRVLRRARGAGVHPTLILASPYKRALETAEIAALELGYTGKLVRVEALIPEGSPHDVWEELRSRAGEKSVLLASHEPLMSTLAAFLLGNRAMRIEMKKGALARIDCENQGRDPAGELKWLLTASLAGE